MKRFMIANLASVALVLLLAACAPVAQPTAVSPTAVPPTPTASIPPEALTWWNDTVFYEIFVRSFQDSDGDGVGDIEGVIQKLDYLQDLGVTGIWLMPVAQSPSYHGYDVVDYYAVDDEYGTKEDFLRLIDEAHKRDIRVIVDLVLNHTSSAHPWFVEAQSPDSEWRDWYVWSDTQPTGAGWHASASGYYYGQFWEEMPDLNYRNPDVSAEMLNVVEYWLEDMNVDGFRLDAIKFLVETDGQLENTPETHAWLEAFYDFYKGIEPTAYTVAEVWTTTNVAASYVGDEVDSAFEFDLARAMLQSAARANKTSVEFGISQALDAFPDGQFATFLANHDQKRTRSSLFSDEQVKVAATMQLTFPGIPFIYYGEEIGMQGDKPDENIRRPMQWSAEAGGGFTTGEPWHDFFTDWEERNVAAQADDPDSLLNHYRALIALRNDHPELRTDALIPVATSSNRVYAYLRPGESRALLVLINLHKQDDTDYTLELAPGALPSLSAVNLLLGEGAVVPPELTDGGFSGYRPLATLEGQSSIVIELRY